jgi:AcrR family transcriptional regulator
VAKQTMIQATIKAVKQMMQVTIQAVIQVMIQTAKQRRLYYILQNDNEWMNELIKAEKENGQMTEKQIRILAAAIEIFAEKGYAATSTSEIAKKAEVAEGTIFRHYKTKKDLLLSISASLMSKLIAPILAKDLNKIMQKEYCSFQEFLKVIMINRREFVKEHKALIKVLIQEVPFHSELQEQFKKTILLPFLEEFFRVIDSFKEKGEIINISTKSVARLIATPAIGYFLMKYILDILEETDENYDIDELIEFIMHGLGGPRT